MFRIPIAFAFVCFASFLSAAEPQPLRHVACERQRDRERSLVAVLRVIAVSRRAGVAQARGIVDAPDWVELPSRDRQVSAVFVLVQGGGGPDLPQHRQALRPLPRLSGARQGGH